MNDFYDNVSVSRPNADVVSGFINKVFGLMGLGLGVTTLVSFATLHFRSLLLLSLNFYWLFAIAELGVVFYLASRVYKIEPGRALAWFLFYSALNGITLTPICLAYTHSAITSAFLTSAGMFAGMAVWGYVTKKDLSTLGGLMTMGVFGILLATLVNFFLQSSGLDTFISYAGVGIFLGLTAWDVQKLKTFALSGQMTGGIAVMGALNLYLDFINLFIFILRILGGKRD